MGVRDMLAGLTRPKGQNARERAKREFAKGDNAAGVAALLELGEDADPEVLQKLGNCYETGTGVLPNFVTAVAWYERAAAKGNLEAQVRLGDIYLVGRHVVGANGESASDERTGASRLRPKGVSVPKDLEKAFRWNSTAAERGDPAAQARLGYQYATGLGVDPDYALAERWFCAAAEQDGMAGQFGLGMLYGGSYLGSPDFAKAVEWFEKAASQGDISSKFFLGMLLKDGLGVERDEQRAVQLLTEAAEAEHTEAMFRLGQLHTASSTLEVDPTLAETWLMRAAARGHIGALLALAQYLIENTALPDYATAATLLRQAADMDDASAQFNLGQLYRAGLGVPQDNEAAAFWFRKAADAGVVGAIESLGLMHASGNGLERDYGMAFSLLRKAADAGSALAEVGIASLYSFGLGAERNPEAALASYLRAAERGSAEACVRLGVIYATGDGVEQDYAKAAEWYAKAELQGDADGKTNLAFLYIRGLGVSLDQARGIRMLGELSEAGSLSTVWSLYHLHDSGTYVPADPAEARRWLERAADMGSGVAACEFARQVEYAIRGAPAFDRVLAWLLAAAEREDAAAQEVLGRWYYEGKLVPRDEATALRWNSLAAEGGNPFAQAWLGDVLNQGLAGVIVDHAAARRWYEKAAIQRHVGALTLLTHMVFSEAADDEALRNLFSLWLNIAQAGDGGAQLQVAGFYLEGTGTEPSIAEAVKWLKAAAEGGNADAQVRLGGLLLQSKEAAGDPMQAAALFQQAATRGNVDGEYNLGVCYRLGLGVPVDRDRARSLYFGAAIKGHRSAQLALGDLLVEIGDENTLKEAVKWYEEAAAVGIPEALFGLAHLYETGKGVYPDRERAVQLNRRAAESGHAGAEAALARLAGVQSAA